MGESCTCLERSIQLNAFGEYDIMKQDSFFKSIATIGIGTIINLIIGFFTTPIITRIIDPDIYGQFSIFSMYTSLALIILCLGMDQSLVRFYYRSEEIGYKQRLALECVILPLILSFVFLASGFCLIYFGIIKFKFDIYFTILLCFNILINVVFRFSLLFVRLNHNNALYARLQIYQKIIYVVLAIGLLEVIQLDGMSSLVIAAIVAVLCCFFVSVFSQRKFLPNTDSKIIRSEFDELLKFGYPFIFSMGITSLFQSLDKLSLDYYRTDAEVGVYSSAMTYITLFNVIQTSFNTAWAPKASEHFTKKPEDKELYKKAFNIISLVMFSVGIALILFKDLFALILGPKYREASGIMPFLIFSPIMYTISETTVCGINFKKKSVMHIWIALGACLMNFIGNTALVPRIGCKGAAISTGLSYILFFVLRSIFGQKYYRVGFKWGRLIILTVLTVVLAAYNTFFPFSAISVLIAVICYLVIAICYKDTISLCVEIIKSKILPILKRRLNNDKKRNI